MSTIIARYLCWVATQASLLDGIFPFFLSLKVLWVKESSVVEKLNVCGKQQCQDLSVAQTHQFWTPMQELAMLKNSLVSIPISPVPLIPLPFFSSPTFMVRYLSSQIPSFLLFLWLRDYRSCFIFPRKKQKLVNLTCSMCFAGYEAPNLRYGLILKSHVCLLVFGF